jgi:hypothetical protein
VYVWPWHRISKKGIVAYGDRMGINSKDLQLLVRLAEEGHIHRAGKVIEIGAQQLSNSFLRSVGLVRNVEAIFGARRPFALSDPGPATSGPGSIELLDSKAPFARDFWISLGFDYVAIDVDGSPGSIPLDLNFDSVPAELQSKCNLVTNLGTTEHICNQMNAFKVIHDLAAPGAIMIHHLPAGGAPNHGLVNYNPKFFWCLARSNDYKWLYMDYYGGDEPYALPENIAENVGRYEPNAVKALGERITVDYAIQVALQKRTDIPFVPPLDIEQDDAAVETAMRRRYWTVFEPRILEAVRRNGGARALITQESEASAMKNKEGPSAGWPISLPDRGQKDISDENRRALDAKIASASHEIRVAMARALADSEESIRNAVDHKVSDSEEAIRNAINRTVSESEEAIRNEVKRVVANSEEAVRTAVTAAVTAELRQATIRIPGRRFVSLVCAVSALVAVALVAVIFAVAHVLHF